MQLDYVNKYIVSWIGNIIVYFYFIGLFVSDGIYAVVVVCFGGLTSEVLFLTIGIILARLKTILLKAANNMETLIIYVYWFGNIWAKHFAFLHSTRG